jgi:DNA polymerase/3'-5' exonuclease PolX
VLCDIGLLHDIEGVGESIGARVEEYLRSGALGYRRQVRREIPGPVKSFMALRVTVSRARRVVPVVYQQLALLVAD